MTLPGYQHDICASVHPMAATAPFFREFDLASRGVRLLQPEINFAHPLDGGRAAVSHHSLEQTAAGLGRDERGYRRLFGPLLRQADEITDFFLTSAFRRLPPVKGFAGIAGFGLQGLPSVGWLARRHFDDDAARALIAGAAAHGMLDLSRPLTAALGMFLGMMSHHNGWPLI